MTAAFGRIIEHVAEPIAEKVVGKEAVEVATKAAGKEAVKEGVEAAGKTGSEKVAEEAAKGKSLFSKGSTFAKKGGKWVKEHPKKAAGGAAGLAGLGYLNSFRAEGGMAPLGEAAQKASDTVTTGLDGLFGKDGGPVGNATGNGVPNNGIVEFDPDQMKPFIAALHHAADGLAQAPAALDGLIEELRKRLSTDPMGTSTRDGKVSPLYADMDAALTALHDQGTKLIHGLQQQFAGDAEKLTAIIEAQIEVQAASAKAMSQTDTTL